MKVDLADAQAIITPAPGKSFDPTEIPKVVKDAGFSPSEIQLTAIGTLALRDDFLVLGMSGAVHELVLAGGRRAEELKKRSDLLEKRLRVTGKLHPSHADQSPGLTVARWGLASPPE